MKTLVLMIGAIGLITFNPRLAYSCSCVNIGSPREELKKAKAVFVGEVIQIYSGSGDKEYPAIVELKVERHWKG